MNSQPHEIALAKVGSKVGVPVMVTFSSLWWTILGDKEFHLAYDCFASPYEINDKTPPAATGRRAVRQAKAFR